ncbi:GrpB protein-domain-containing protein [Dunaliella salina]|uniref:GrpB protein-domain-containing protein n=1 Tax=Dunaliella salina TaxID=3046 RepID=A0ABQ7G7E6_DUNSA|nr:GrpB protein-domain-containing protein [Dunaliella salina]|eukprot:KAF5830528.1 GrpB protein-domain-containing protein [Dunaliella salina]
MYPLMQQLRNSQGDDPVIVCDYDHQWPQEFADEAAALQQAIPEHLLDASVSHPIVHVGSTSVPGLKAKPVVDICVVVKNLEPWQPGCEGASVLQNLGYDFRGESGVPDRIYFRRGCPVKYHVHIQRLGSHNYVKQLRLKAYLLHHEHDRNLYGQLKVVLAQAFKDNRQGYRESKDPFLKQCHSKAHAWLLSCEKLNGGPFDLTAGVFAGPKPQESTCSTTSGESGCSTVSRMSGCSAVSRSCKYVAEYAAEQLHFQAHQWEPLVSGIVVNASVGAQSVLDRESAEHPSMEAACCRLQNFPTCIVKQKDSIARKLLLNPHRLECFEIARQQQQSMLHAGSLEGCPLLFALSPVLYDALRYSLVLSDDVYACGVTSFIEYLKLQGCSQVQLFNFWPVRGEQREHVGIHAFFRLHDYVFEVQFHTEYAVQLNLQHMRPLYEQFREELDPVKKEQLRRDLINGWGTVPVPPCVHKIPGMITPFPANFHESFVPTYHGGAAAV